MNAVRKRTWLPANLLLLATLAVAQSGALAHAFKHDPATPQNPTCAICVTLSQLDATCVAVIVTTEVVIVHAAAVVVPFAAPVSLHLPAAKQRGPPLPL